MKTETCGHSSDIGMHPDILGGTQTFWEAGSFSNWLHGDELSARMGTYMERSAVGTEGIDSKQTLIRILKELARKELPKKDAPS